MKAKKLGIVKFSVVAFILGLMGFWIFKTAKPFNEFAYTIIGVLLLIVGFVIYSGIQALKDAKSGLNPEDELSKRIQEKAAAKTFKISIFMWLFIELFLFEMTHIDTIIEAKIVIGLGLMGMGLIFFFNWLYYSKVGISDENKA